MALYAISAVYFAGVMVRLMLTLTPVVCMLSAVAFSSVFEHYLGDDNKRQSPPAEDSGDEDDRKNAGNLYDKVGACWIVHKKAIRFELAAARLSRTLTCRRVYPSPAGG